MSLAITVADVMVKTAQIRLIGVERTIGSGWMLVKIAGDVAAVRTALSAGEETARAHQGFVACTTIARPAKEISVLASTTKPPRDELVQKTTALPAITLTASAAHTTTGPESVQEDPDAEKAVPPVKQVAEGSTDNIIQVDAINEPVEMAGEISKPNASAKSPPDEYGENNLWRRSKHFRPREISLLTTIFRQRQREPLPLCSMSNPEYFLHQFHTQVKPDDETADAGSQQTRERKQAVAITAELLVTCKICGDPSCPRHKGQPRSRCIHNQKSILR
jgi:microcompartment protein CcmL/EutN